MAERSILGQINAFLERCDNPERRIAERLGRQADRLRHDALMSGALPGEFKVVHIFKGGRTRGYATELQ